MSEPRLLCVQVIGGPSLEIPCTRVYATNTILTAYGPNDSHVAGFERSKITGFWLIDNHAFEAPHSAPSDSADLTAKEQEYVRSKLDEILTEMSSRFDLTSEQLEELKKDFAGLKKQAGSSSKRTWTQTVTGCLYQYYASKGLDALPYEYFASKLKELLVELSKNLPQLTS